VCLLRTGGRLAPAARLPIAATRTGRDGSDPPRPVSPRPADDPAATRPGTHQPARVLQPPSDSSIRSSNAEPDLTTARRLVPLALEAACPPEPTIRDAASLKLGTSCPCPESPSPFSARCGVFAYVGRLGPCRAAVARPNPRFQRQVTSMNGYAVPTQRCAYTKVHLHKGASRQRCLRPALNPIRPQSPAPPLSVATSA
jgi:hypothetical protein